MCRSIKTLRRPGDGPTEDEIRAAALQFVRKVSGMREPSEKNREVFDAAVTEIAAASGVLLGQLPPARQLRNNPEGLLHERPVSSRP